MVTKIGFDATAKPDDRVEGNERALPPGQATESVEQWLRQHIDPQQRRRWLK